MLLSQSFYDTDQIIQKDLSFLDIDSEIGSYQFNADSLRYIRIGQSSDRPVLIAIHGAPGSCSDYSSYWSSILSNHYDLIFIDRPGYGEYADAQNDVSIEEQAEIIYGMLEDQAPGKKVAILSHSYGGPVGAVLASILDTSCLGHIMVAPVIDPESEELFWYSAIPLKWPFRIIASKDWKMASLEKESHVAQLNELKNTWPFIQSPTIHIHGTSDWLASFENVAFCKQQFDDRYYSAIVIEKGSHFILWDNQVQSNIVQLTVDLLVGE